jgi:hypothetical protein
MDGAQKCCPWGVQAERQSYDVKYKANYVLKIVRSPADSSPWLE